MRTPIIVTVIIIPDHESWIVTMWHFGHGSPSEYTGEKFEVAWEDGQNALFRIYHKDLKAGGTRIRERQEYPNKRFDEVMDEKPLNIVSLSNEGLDKVKVSSIINFFYDDPNI
jgi:hypothetical protein